MKCSRCGAECKDTQSFCLNCGTPLHAKEEFQGMEEELANSVGELLDGFDEEDDDEDFENYDIKFDESVFEDEAKKVRKELQVENIYSKSRSSESSDEDEEEWEYDEDKYFDSMQVNHMEEELEDPFEEIAPKEKEKKPVQKKQANKKKKIAITCAVVAVVLAVAIGGGIYILNNIHFNLTSFEDYYRLASKEYKRADYSIALTDSKAALKKAQKAYDSEDNESKKKEAKQNIIKARELINDIYEKTNKIDDEYADNMLAIVTLDDSYTEYYVKLAKYYSENKPPQVLTDFLRTVDDDNEKANKALADYIVPVPKADKDSGKYTEKFAVTLTCDKNCIIYYTLDGQDPSVYGVEYAGPIQITNFRVPEDTNEENGVTVLKTITVNGDGVESKIEELTYEIILESAEPVVTPDSGQYDDYTEIKVSVPEGSKCYYTIGEGSTKPEDPDESSTLYIASEKDVPEGEEYEPLQMPRGTHIMKFIIIDEYGIASDVAVRSYNLEIPRAISLNEAEDLIKETLIEDKKIIDAEGHNEAGHIIDVQWDETVIIDNDEYFMIFAIEKDDKDAEIAKTVYAVNTYDKTVVKEVKQENGVYVIPEEETEGETETTNTR
ncbi:MAG: chitobiase/beta-hexosaminidase C-terminal domain-containing protein [Lachnospiraceae bacterium]|nr:chitobiase/beta-hexosaminidase C-terminal domain-containing protein [Lachnospiraceae bacterium]